MDNAEESAYIAMPVSDDLVRLLRPGDNVIAIEVHQASTTSNDLVLDLDLTATFRPPVNDVYGLGRDSNGAFFLYWLDSRWELQASPDLREWLPLPAATSPWDLSLDQPSEFYRWAR